MGKKTGMNTAAQHTVHTWNPARITYTWHGTTMDGGWEIQAKLYKCWGSDTHIQWAGGGGKHGAKETGRDRTSHREGKKWTEFKVITSSLAGVCFWGFHASFSLSHTHLRCVSCTMIVYIFCIRVESICQWQFIYTIYTNLGITCMCAFVHRKKSTCYMFPYLFIYLFFLCCWLHTFPNFYYHPHFFYTAEWVRTIYKNINIYIFRCVLCLCPMEFSCELCRMCLCVSSKADTHPILIVPQLRLIRLAEILRKKI